MANVAMLRWQQRLHRTCLHWLTRNTPASLPAPAARLVLVAPDEWAKGSVRVKDLASREESDVPLDQLV